MENRVEHNQVRILDGFFARYQELVRSEVIPYQWAALNDRIPGAEKSGCIRNFRIAAGEAEGEFTGMVFQDSDLGKWLEAVAYSLAGHPDAELERTADEMIDLIGRAQQPDGYLDTYFIVKQPKNRWRCIRDCHELYCAGHLLEAAVAYYRATGKEKFLNIMRRYVDCISRVFGHGEGQIPAYPGHEEIELALCRLYDATGDEKALELAKYFIDERGREPKYFVTELDTVGDTFHWERSDPTDLTYYQAHLPVREQQTAEGHAVRAMYLYTGMADVAMRTGDESLKDACRRLFRSVTEKRMYITGAVGSTCEGEAFTFDYDLPNDTVYGETCASIGLMFFCKRMLEMDGIAAYADVMERALYNTALAGMSLDGKSFFYVNPLEVFPEADKKDPRKSHVKPVRQKWFTCACCPPNLARMLTGLGDYVYQVDSRGVTVNLFVSSELKTPDFTLTMRSGVPVDGKISLCVAASNPSASPLRVRRPEWAGEVRCSRSYTEADGYLVFDDVFSAGASIELEFSMPVRRVYADLRVRDNIGKTALMRGPLVYCMEEADNGSALHLLRLPPESEIEEYAGSGVLEGTVLLSALGKRLMDSETGLYRFHPCRTEENAKLTFIPYSPWANRGEGEMQVWVRE